MKNNNNSDSSEILNEIAAMRELVAVIVDYYCFKNNDSINDDDSFKNSFNKEDNNEIIPDDVNGLIEEAFKKQLKKIINN
jgi:hypothetical protein